MQFLFSDLQLIVCVVQLGPKRVFLIVLDWFSGLCNLIFLQHIVENFEVFK